MKLNKPGFAKSLIASAILTAGLASQAYGQEMEEIVVQGDLGSLPGENVQSVFGFNKSVLETPRSLSTVSEEMMEKNKVSIHLFSTEQVSSATSMRERSGYQRHPRSLGARDGMLPSRESAVG